ncbi:MAG: right-handed parallel beta-helix repeat-containing protein [Acidimicrobiia bacterium]
MSKGWLLLLAGTALTLSGCAGPPSGEPSPAALGDPATDSPSEWSGATLRVPQDYPTIQSAVDASGPGDLILIDRGTYREGVQVETPGLTLRGVDRNEVVIDGEFERPNGVSVLSADGVVVENMTAINNTSNGFYWGGVRGYRGSYLTAVNNAVYGLYAFDSSDGLFEHTYAFGSPDAGLYIGQCDPCQATITDSISEWNGLGYSGTNASSDLYIVNSVFRHNVAGVAPNTLDGELLPPFHNVSIVGNLVHDNGNVDAPALAFEWGAQGNGILLAGGGDSLVARNRVFNHPQSGIAIFPMLDANFYMSFDHHVVGNIVEGSGLADLTLGGPATSGNCFEDNEHDTSLPAALELKQPCEGIRLPALFEIGSTTAQLGRLFESGRGLQPEVDITTLPDPEPQPGMPDPLDAPARPAVDVFNSSSPDLDGITTPAMPPAWRSPSRKESTSWESASPRRPGCSSVSTPTCSPWSSTPHGWCSPSGICHGGKT